MWKKNHFRRPLETKLSGKWACSLKLPVIITRKWWLLKMLFVNYVETVCIYDSHRFWWIQHTFMWRSSQSEGVKWRKTDAEKHTIWIRHNNIKLILAFGECVSGLSLRQILNNSHEVAAIKCDIMCLHTNTFRWGFGVMWMSARLRLLFSRANIHQTETD